MASLLIAFFHLSSRPRQFTVISFRYCSCHILSIIIIDFISTCRFIIIWFRSNALKDLQKLRIDISGYVYDGHHFLQIYRWLQIWDTLYHTIVAILITVRNAQILLAQTVTVSVEKWLDVHPEVEDLFSFILSYWLTQYCKRISKYYISYTIIPWSSTLTNKIIFWLFATLI